MIDQDGILDNRRNKLSDFLREALEDADMFRLVTAYFSLGGFATLQDELLKHRKLEVRFLYGLPNIRDGEKKPLLFAITEEGLVCTDQGILAQAPLARACARWIRRENVEVRTLARDKFLHGKMYLINRGSAFKAVVGSSNFTQRGMGESPQSNLELNVKIRDSQTKEMLAAWFDGVWDDESLVKNAKHELVRELEHCYKEYSPEHIYYKTLYELFRDEIEERRELEQSPATKSLSTTKIWKTLYEFQRHGVSSVLAKIGAYNGCILADSVGLGKTYTALAVIKYFELRNKSVLVMCPKRLKQNWEQFDANHVNNPFKQDRFRFTLAAHTDLDRKKGKIGNVPVEDFDWASFDLIVLDESHNFRNESPRVLEDGERIRKGRYERLMNIIKSGGKTNMLLLSATPVNTSFLDFGNQVKLITERDKAAFKHSLRIDDVDRVVSRAQRTFENWSQLATEDKTSLLDELDGDFLNLLRGLTIARSRKQIVEFYKEDLEEIGGFPRRKPPKNKNNDIDTHGAVRFEDVIEKIMNLEYLVYRPSQYLNDKGKRAALLKTNEGNFTQEMREKSICGLLLIILLKRLESSVDSLRLSLNKTIGKIDVRLDQIRKYLENQANGEIDEDYSEADGDAALEEDYDILQGKSKYRLEDLDVERWRQDLMVERKQLESLHALVADIHQGRDAKLRDLLEIIKGKSKLRRSRKILIFTTYIDTAEYLYRCVAPKRHDYGVNVGLITGAGTESTLDWSLTFDEMLNAFAPEARRVKLEDWQQIDVLIATDCISEGQNLYDCDTVVNYDIHWNPVRLIQRLGRIDRIGTPHLEITMHNFWPMKDLDKYLNLEQRVKDRMHIVDLVGGDDDIFRRQQELEKNFRASQARQIKEEGKIIDLEEASDSLNMSDLTLDYFFGQLLRYLDKHKKELENTPAGAYAVTSLRRVRKSTEGIPGRSVIFFLRNKNPKNKQGQNPIYPFYLMLVDKDGVRFSYPRARTILDFFDRACMDKAEPLKSLCDAFTKQISDPKTFRFYQKLLEKAITDIFKPAEAPDLTWNGADPEVAIRAAEELELVTWLIIASDKK